MQWELGSMGSMGPYWGGRKRGRWSDKQRVGNLWSKKIERRRNKERWGIEVGTRERQRKWVDRGKRWK